jgi:sulfatase maturation enzyme AslB (radical SAM superfamily)
MHEKNPTGKYNDTLWSIVLIELTSHCNFACSFCPSEMMNRKKTRMPTELCKKILKELGEKSLAKTVFFHVVGEPLLHKDVLDLIHYANNQGLSVSLYTNGALLNRGRSKKLIAALQKGRVVISLQDTDPDKFQIRCRGSISWEQYNANILSLLEAAESSNSSATVQIHCMLNIQKLRWNFHKIYAEKKRIEAVYRRWQSLLDVNTYRSINIVNPTASYPLGKRSSFFVKHAGTWDNQLIDEEWEVKPSYTGHCALMSDTFAILSDGTCTFCCNDYEGKLNLGNAFRQPLESIFHGKASSTMRSAELDCRLIHQRCQECRGTLVSRTTKMPIPNRNLFTDYFIFKEHLSRYGILSTSRKALYTVKRRAGIFGFK